jgi:hypothetical protein
MFVLGTGRPLPPVIPGPRSGARNPDTLTVQGFGAVAALDSGLAYGAPE